MLLRIYAVSRMSSTEKMQHGAVFRERLRNRRHFLNLTQKELAEKGGFGERSIPAWEGGESEPSLVSLIHLAEVLDTTVGWLIGELPADGGAVLNDSYLQPVWPLLNEKTLRSVLADLSQHESEAETAALLHMERVVGELRTRARVAGVSSRQAADVAVASMQDAERAPVRPVSPPRPGAAAPSAHKPGRVAGGGKAS